MDLYDRRASQVLGVLVLWVRDRACAEEILAAAFEFVWRHPESFPQDTGLTPFAWILGLARDRAIHHLRSGTGVVVQTDAGVEGSTFYTATRSGRGGLT